MTQAQIFVDMNVFPQAMEAIANQGKGALWMFLKVGAFVALAIGAGAWVWNQMHP